MFSAPFDKSKHFSKVNKIFLHLQLEFYGLLRYTDKRKSHFTTLLPIIREKGTYDIDSIIYNLVYTALFIKGINNTIL